MTATFTWSVSPMGVTWRQAWEHTVGSGHARLATRAAWKAYLPAYDLPAYAREIALDLAADEAVGIA